MCTTSLKIPSQALILGYDPFLLFNLSIIIKKLRTLGQLSDVPNIHCLMQLVRFNINHESHCRIIEQFGLSIVTYATGVRIVYDKNKTSFIFLLRAWYITIYFKSCNVNKIFHTLRCRVLAETASFC